MKTILVTGASRGIGKALAMKFLAEGYFVIGTSTSGNNGIKNSNFTNFQLDFSNAESIQDCAKKIVSVNKKIDIFINNAGVWLEGDDQPNINVAVLREMLEINLIGPIDFTEQLLSLINEGGHIINISSRRASFEYNKDESLYPDYTISKTALNMFSKTLANRLKGKIIVSAVHPGFVQTDMNEGGGDITAEEAAQDIYLVAVSEVETGQFWFKGEKYPW